MKANYPNHWMLYCSLLAILLTALAACSPGSSTVRIETLPSVPGDLIVQIEAGQTMLFTVRSGVEGFGDQKNVGARWSVEPSQGASIDSNGILTTSPDLPHGTILTVKATTLRGTFSEEVVVYQRDVNPLIGRWVEVEQIACDTGERFTPEHEPDSRARFIVFLADDRVYGFTAMFEHDQLDYSGRYSVDLGAGTFTITDVEVIQGQAPVAGQDIRFEIDAQGQLILPESILIENELIAGSPRGCGQVLAP